MSTISISGGGNHNVNVYGNGTVIAGNGNDSINISGNGNVVIGNGRDTISIGGSAQITEIGISGHDTISLGLGNDTISVQGYATVTIAGGSVATCSTIVGGGAATISGGSLVIHHLSNGITQDFALAGKMTLIGGTSLTEFAASGGSTVLKGGSGHDVFIGGSGHDTMTSIGTHNVFEFLASAAGGQHLITNFVSGDQLNVEGHSLTYFISHNEVTSLNGNTYISVDNGKTTIELQGVTTAHPAQTPETSPVLSLNHIERF